jgi:predicted flap endonuclease-1-like 5' DNA nuclease
MSGKVVFAATFLFLVGTTIGIPSLPPGGIIYDFLGVPHIALEFWVFSVAALVNGIINGLFWGGIVSFSYFLINCASRGEPLPPMPEQPYMPEPMPPRMPRQPRIRKSPPERRKIKTYVPLDQDIETIEGIGDTYGSKLRNSGIKTIEDLLRMGATRNGQHVLTGKVGIASSLLLKWIHRADLFRVKGIGTQYSALLESAGVFTVADLSSRDSFSLRLKLKTINKEKNLVRRPPSIGMVNGWVKKAKNLNQIVE